MVMTKVKTGMVQHLSSKLMPLAVAIALLIAVLAPLTYWTLEHHKLQHLTAIHAEELADRFRQVALESPTLWKYQTYKFIAITEGLHPAIEVNGFRILDEKGEVITGVGQQKISGETPVKKLSLTKELYFTLGTAPIIFNDRQVGTVEVFADDTPVLRNSLVLFIFWSLAGTGLALLVYRFPVTVVRKMAGEIEELLLTTQQSEEKYRSIFEHAYDIIYLLNADSTFRSLNPAFEQITGWTAEEWIGKPFAPLIHPEDLPYANDIFSKTLAGESSPSFRLRLARKSGVYFYADLCITPLGGDTEIGAVGIFRDVTERKRAEDEIRKLNGELENRVQKRTQQLLEAQEELIRSEKLAILGQLSGSVGHELRNPLGVMSNAVYYLKMVHADADETTREYLDIIKNEIDNALRIITDLLDFARTKTPQTKTVTSRQLLDESLVKCVIPKNVELQTELADNLPSLRVDPLQIVQVFQNLITNAVQAMPDGGALRVAARRVLSSELRVLSSDLKAETLCPKPDTDVALTSELKLLGSDSELKTQNSKLDGDFIEISVTDTGGGITPENRKRLFQPLFTTKTKGIGLGLVVCRSLVEANGGRIDVASEAGKGTTFAMILPIERGGKYE